MVLHGLTVWESRTPPEIYESPGFTARAFLFSAPAGAACGGDSPAKANTILRMTADSLGEGSARGTAVRGAAVGLLLAAALLAPAILSGGVPARGDLPDFFWPMKAYTAERWAAGEVPLWNPLSASGEPWLAQLQSGALYPGDLPFLLGWKEGALLGIALHLALASAGAAYWLWSLGASRPASLLAGGLFAGGGAFLSLVPVYNNACSAAWLPWLFACARRVVVGQSRGAGLAVAVAGAFLAGEPALAAAGSVAAIVLAVYAGTEGEAPATEAPRLRLLARAGIPLLVGLALAGAALLPFGTLLRDSERRESTTREEALAQPVGRSDLADLVAPPIAETTRAPAPGRGGYLLTLAFGALPLLLVTGVGAGFPGRRRLLAGLAVLGAGGFLLSLGQKGLLAPVLFDLGVLKGLRFPARWAVFPHLVLAVAAGAGLDGWLWGRFGKAPGPAPGDEGFAEARENRARRTVTLSALALGIALAALLGATAWLAPEARASRDQVRTLLAAALALAGIGLVAAARISPAGPSRRVGTVLAALAVLPLPVFGGEALAPAPAGAISRAPGALGELARSPDGGRVFAPAGHDRTLSLRWRYAGGSSWGEESVSRASAALAGYTNLFHGIASVSSASPIGNPRAERLVGVALAGGDPAVLLPLLNVRHVLTPFPARIPGLLPGVEKGGVHRYDVRGPFGRTWFPLEHRIVSDGEAFAALRRPGFDPGKTALVAPPPEGTGLPPARPRGGWAVARFAKDEPERAELTTDASAPSLLVFTRSWDRGWKAKVDGVEVPVLRAQLAYLAVVVPAGEHRLELAYRPVSFRIGLYASAAGLLALLGLALSGPPRRGRP